MKCESDEAEREQKEEEKICVEWFEPEIRDEIQCLICPACSNIYADPILLTCDDIICKQCYELNNNKCPNNKNSKCKNAHLLTEMPSLVTIIKEKRCKCKNEGCLEMINLIDFVNHLKICPKQPVECKFKCDKKIPRELINQHESECPYRIIECKDCHQKIVFKDSEVHRSVCSMTLISCAQCREKILRKNLSEHLDKYCPECIRNCFYYPLGCLEKMKLEKAALHYEKMKKFHVLKYSDFLIGVKKNIEDFQTTFDNKIDTLMNQIEYYIEDIEKNNSSLLIQSGAKNQRKRRITSSVGSTLLYEVPKRRGRKQKKKKYARKINYNYSHAPLARKIGNPNET